MWRRQVHRLHTQKEALERPGAGTGPEAGSGSGRRYSLSVSCFLLHACLFHAEGDLRVLVAEQDVCNARGWVARGVQMLAAVSQVWVFMTH